MFFFFFFMFDGEADKKCEELDKVIQEFREAENCDSRLLYESIQLSCEILLLSSGNYRLNNRVLVDKDNGRVVTVPGRRSSEVLSMNVVKDIERAMSLAA